MESILLVIWITLCIVSWTAQEILNKRIKKYHYKKWVEFGEPSLSYMMFSIESLSKKFKMIHSIFRYLIRGDSELDADLNVHRIKRINQIVLLIGIVVLIFFIIFAMTSTFGFQ